MSATPDSTLANPEQRIADLERQLAEALEQQTATAEILRVISGSPTNVQPTFDAIAAAATTLTDAALSGVVTYDGTLMHLSAMYGVSPEEDERIRGLFPIPADHGTATGRAILTGQVVHVEDLAADPERSYPTLDQSSGQTVLAVPMLREGNPIGAINVQRRHVEPFTDKQIDLFKTFADQAVIAIENVRLFNETKEALEQQTATAEVLQVINSSPGDLAPVFDAMLEKATRLCEGTQGALWTIDGERVKVAATYQIPAEFVELLRRIERGELKPFGQLRQIMQGERVVHTTDFAKLDRAANPLAQAAIESGRVRTLVAVALVKDGVPVGAFGIARREVRPFTDKQIALLQNFAAQAVIAMENARLITETREALEQQTATAEVLQVINSSPGDLTPVFDAMLERATRLCEATYGHLYTYDGKRYHTVAVHGEAQFVEWRLQRGPIEIPVARKEWQPVGTSGAPLERLVAGERVVVIDDAPSTEAYRASVGFRAQVDASGIRSGVTVALRKDAALRGAITVYRQEVRPFSEREVALLQNFAAQAVIAMENARLLTETREALEQQTATAEVLGVINSSPGELGPVFDAMLEKTLRLCEAAHGNFLTYDGEVFHNAAFRGEPQFAEYRRQHGPLRPAEIGQLARVVQGGGTLHRIDAREGEAYRDDPAFRQMVDGLGIRTSLTVPLRKGDALVGAVRAYRREVRPFTDKQIALVENFAAQAVIAMENARLLTETREALEQQTATAEVLQGINSSPGDLAPVFDAMLDKAMHLCGAAFGILWTYDGDRFRPTAHRGLPARFAEFLEQDPPAPEANPGSGHARILAGERLIHVADGADEELYRAGDPYRRALVDLGGARTGLMVPLRKDETVIGCFMIYRQEVRLFSDKEIALVQNFAAQAVIAMENARLITETREALEQQTATAEVLQVINSSPGDLAPVFDAILEKAHSLCGAAHGSLMTYDGERFRLIAARALPPRFAELLRQPFLPRRFQERLLRGERFVHVPDVAAGARNPDDPIPRASDEAGIRTLLMVPLRKDDALLGYITAHREEVRPFTDKQIALLQNFAAQAVIAMENARLITETREALEQQTATAELLGVINSSPGDIAPVFEAMLEKAIRLCGGIQGALWTFDGERAKVAASHGNTPEFVAMLREREGAGLGPPEAVGLTMRERFLHIPDIVEHELYRAEEEITKGAVELSGVRSLVGVALVKDGASIGAFMIGRREVQAFSEKQIALLQSFAAQAVIAMDNARLLDEIRQRQAELRVTFDNMGDGVAMFDSELRLAAWNLNFQRILDVPDELPAERPSYSDYIRFLARRGEFGNADIEAELSRRLEAIGQELRFEHTRPDGRVIEVRRNAVPGGGFVIIYGDVTERKLAEAEIRAARDTAERALGELRTAQTSLVHAQKMAALGQLTAGIAHEIKNPLNFVNNFAELSGELLVELKETTAPAVATLGEDERAAVDEVVEMLRGNLDKIAEHGKRADGIVKSMLEHSRGVSGERRVVDLNALIEEALNLAYHGARAQDASFNITLERDFDRGLAPTELAPQEMTRVFLNLFGNGFTTRRQRDGAGADFRPTLTVATRDLGDAVEVRVRDNGTGIQPEIRDKLFQPFVTTKPTGEGTGLGLSIAWDIVTQQHGGTIEVDSRLGGFTEFTIRLPRQAMGGAV
jgi:GAF domain-containing protein/nitrogen-specific signal transduction histidine kinase